MSAPGAPRLVSFPLLDGVTPEGRLPWSSGNKSVREVMLHVLLTRPGERLMRPELGAGLRDFVHRPNNETTRALIADAVRRSLERWEPRVQLDDVQVLPNAERLSHVNVSIRYRLRAGAEPERFDLALELDALT